jgi:hypothetical protein
VDWANERYVRLYTRDTTTWRLLSFEAQALMPQLLRKVDRSGVLDLGGVPPHEAIAAHLHKWPLEFIGAGLRDLEKHGIVVVQDDSLVMPNFTAAQEVRQSDAQRQRDSRERRRAQAIVPVPNYGKRVGPDTPGYIYVLATQDSSLVKIGFTSSSVMQRVRQLETARGEPLSLVTFFEAARGMERELHLKFASARRPDGEWFENTEEIRGWIKSVVTPCHTESREVTPSLAVPSQAVPSQKKRAERRAVCAGFDEFWSGYPVKKSKQDALRAWTKLNPSSDLQARIRADVAARVEKDSDWLRGAIPYPATYLNGERWTDELRTQSPRPVNGISQGPAMPGINPNVLARQSCGCEVVRDPGARDGRKTLPCKRHLDRATEVRA